MQTNDSKFLSFDRDRRAFEFPVSEVQIIIQFVFVQELPAFEINQEIRCAVAQMPAGNIVFERNKRVCGIGQVVQEDFDSGIGKGFSDQANNPFVVFKKFLRVVGNCLAIIFLE